MKRFVAIVLLLVIAVGIWSLFAFTSLPQLLIEGGSSVLFTVDDINITLSTLLWIILIIVAWLGFTVLGFAIDPNLGYAIFRIGYYVLIIFLSSKREGSSSSSTSRSGSGSGRSGRGN